MNGRMNKMRCDEICVDGGFVNSRMAGTEPSQGRNFQRPKCTEADSHKSKLLCTGPMSPQW